MLTPLMLAAKMGGRKAKMVRAIGSMAPDLDATSAQTGETALALALIRRLHVASGRAELPAPDDD